MERNAFTTVDPFGGTGLEQTIICFVGQVSESDGQFQRKVDLTEVCRYPARLTAKDIFGQPVTLSFICGKHWEREVDNQTISILQVIHRNHSKVVRCDDTVLFTIARVCEATGLCSTAHCNSWRVCFLPVVIRSLKLIDDGNIPRSAGLKRSRVDKAPQVKRKVRCHKSRVVAGGSLC